MHGIYGIPYKICQYLTYLAIEAADRLLCPLSLLHLNVGVHDPAVVDREDVSDQIIAVGLDRISRCLWKRRVSFVIAEARRSSASAVSRYSRASSVSPGSLLAR